MYRLTNDPDSVLRLSDSTLIPRGHRWWDGYEAWLADGNEPEPAPDLRVAEARTRRDTLLRTCDWTQLDDAPLSIAAKSAWAVYRSALRALPALPGFPDVEWPQVPVLADGTADQSPVQS